MKLASLFRLLVVSASTTGAGAVIAGDRTDASDAAPEALQFTSDVTILKLIADAETALVMRDHSGAEQHLKRSLALPENMYTPRARELMALVHERTGRKHSARDLYRDYLKRYPTGDDAVRVTQRLEALTPTVSDNPKLTTGDEQLGVWKSNVSGSIAQFYLRDRSHSRLANIGRPDFFEPVDNRINVDELLSLVDASAVTANAASRLEARVSMGHVAEFRPVTLVGADRRKGSYNTIRAVYIDADDERRGVSARVGRQSRFGGGIFGRFDGVQAGLRVKPNIRVNVAAGHPVYSSRQTDIDGSRTFGSISVDWNAPDNKWSANIHAFNQRANGITDRRSIGGELRFRSKAASGHALIDYDVSFGKLNAALVIFNANLLDESSLSVAAEYIHYPNLSATNAILGQPLPSLRELRSSFDQATIHRLARDRTLLSRAVTVNYSRPVGKKWQVMADASVSSISGARASGGVDAIFPTGTEAFFGVQAVGSALFKPGDMLSVGLRYAELNEARAFALDGVARLPIGPKLHVEPRMSVSHRISRDTRGRLTVFEPALRLTYQATRSIQLEAAIGAKLFEKKYNAPLLPDKWQEKAFVAHVGYRFRF